MPMYLVFSYKRKSYVREKRCSTSQESNRYFLVGQCPIYSDVIHKLYPNTSHCRYSITYFISLFNRKLGLDLILVLCYTNCMGKLLLDTTSKQIHVEFGYTLSELGKVKTIPDRVWDSVAGVWKVPATQFHAQKAIDLFPDFSVDPRVHKLAKDSKKNTWSVKRDRLYDYQNEGVDFIHSCNGTCIVADDVGLGKTVEVLTWLKEAAKDRNIRKTLVVAPASVVWKWKSEVETWTDMTAQVVEKTKTPLEDVDIYIMSYAIMTRRAMALRLVMWDCVMMDEFQAISNPKTQRSIAASSLQTRHLLLISSTPMLNRPIELFVGLNMIDPIGFPNYFTYARTYCDAHKTPFGWNFKGISNSEELRKRLNNILLRRTKQQAKINLPERTRTLLPIKVDMEEINNAIYNLKESISQGKTWDQLVKLGMLRHAIGIAKVKMAATYAAELLSYSNDKKIVLYAWHRDVVDELANRLQKFGVLTITGEVSQKDRDDRINNFQHLPHNRVMIITKAGGEGINLFAADTMIFVEREWNPMKEEQAEGRIYRIGQTQPVEIIYLIAKDTVDEKIHRLITEKAGMIKELLDYDTPETIEPSIVVDILDYIRSEEL